MFFSLKVSCKDEKIMQKFLLFLTKMKSFPISIKSLPKIKKRKFVTVLKSPHVNKTAQEQFEFRIFSKQFLIRSFRPLTFFLLLKKIKNQSFPGLNFKLTGVLRKSNLLKHVFKIMSPDNLILKNTNSFTLSKKKLCKKNSDKILEINNSKLLFYKKYLQLFDLYGETYFKMLSTRKGVYVLKASLAQLDRATVF